jgi:hypothetical protein
VRHWPAYFGALLSSWVPYRELSAVGIKMLGRGFSVDQELYTSLLGNISKEIPHGRDVGTLSSKQMRCVVSVVPVKAKAQNLGEVKEGQVSDGNKQCDMKCRSAYTTLQYLPAHPRSP